MMVALQRMWIQITADRRRFGLLCACCCLGLLLWARIIVISKPPRTAIAQPNLESNEEAQTSPGGLLADNVPRPRLQVELDRSPERNPFAISDRHFPKPVQIDQITGDGGKSNDYQAENPWEAEQRRIAQWRALISDLTLDAAMSATEQPMAVISGQMYRVGDTVQPSADPDLLFELIEVANRSVILSHDGHRFELRMAPPGG